DLPRRLRPRRDQDASNYRSRRLAHVSANCPIRRCTAWSELAPDLNGPGGDEVFLRRAGGEHGALAGLPVGGELENEYAREVADARDSVAHPGASGLDGLRQAAALSTSAVGD